MNLEISFNFLLFCHLQIVCLVIFSFSFFFFLNNLSDKNWRFPSVHMQIFLQLLQMKIMEIIFKNLLSLFGFLFVYPLAMYCIWEQLNFFLVYFGVWCLLTFKCLHIILNCLSSLQTFWNQCDCLYPLILAASE